MALGSAVVGREYKSVVDLLLPLKRGLPGFCFSAREVLRAPVTRSCGESDRIRSPLNSVVHKADMQSLATRPLFGSSSSFPRILPPLLDFASFGPLLTIFSRIMSQLTTRVPRTCYTQFLVIILVTESRFLSITLLL